MRMSEMALTMVLSLGIADAGAAGAATTSPSDCDRLASHPWDPERVAQPVYWNRIPPDKAVAACREAVEADATPHNMFLYARALAKARRFEEAVDWLLQAAHAGYAQAEFFTRLTEYAQEHGILLIADEVQTGYGRTGKTERLVAPPQTWNGCVSARMAHVRGRRRARCARVHGGEVCGVQRT